MNAQVVYSDIRAGVKKLCPQYPFRRTHIISRVRKNCQDSVVATLFLSFLHTSCFRKLKTLAHVKARESRALNTPSIRRRSLPALDLRTLHATSLQGALNWLNVHRTIVHRVSSHKIRRTSPTYTLISGSAIF